MHDGLEGAQNLVMGPTFETPHLLEMGTLSFAFPESFSACLCLGWTGVSRGPSSWMVDGAHGAEAGRGPWVRGLGSGVRAPLGNEEPVHQKAGICPSSNTNSLGNRACFFFPGLWIFSSEKENRSDHAKDC